jgi:hypothetical protein
MSNKIKSRVGISTLGIIFMLLVSNLTLVIGVSAAVTIPPPKIISVTHDASTSLTTNDVLTVTLVGDPFCLATFDLGDATIGIEMYDDGKHDDGLRWDGIYVGNYTIQEDDKNGIHTVAGHLKIIESLNSSKDAAPDVIIDTVQPEVTDVWHDANTTTLTAKDVLIVTLIGESNLTATFDIGTIATGISMYDDGAHNDGAANDGNYSGNYTVVEAEDDGVWIVTGYLDDGVTPCSSKNAIYNVTIDTALPWIETVWHSANTTTLSTAETLTITLVGDPDCTATFDVGIIAYGQIMNKMTPGTYEGEYIVAEGDDGNWTVTCYLENGSSINKRNATPDVSIDTPSPNIVSVTHSVTHDVNKTLTTNDTFNVTLVGDPGMTAKFNIEKLGTLQFLVKKQGLNETNPGISGIYIGNYTVQSGDDGTWTIVGYLQNTTAGTNPSKKNAIPNIVIDTMSPSIGSVWCEADESVLTTDDILMVYLFGDKQLTASFGIGNLSHAQEQEMIETSDRFYEGSYIIKDGDDGNWTVTGYLDDGVTPRASKNATETVLIDTIQPQIDIVWHNANDSSPENSLDIGDVLNVTLRGESNLTATFDLGTIATEQPMNETAPGTGIYKGNYTVEGDDDGTWTVVGYLNDGTTLPSSKNATFQVIIGDVVPPNAPTGLSISQVPKGNALTLSWNRNEEEDFNRYRIYKSTDGENFIKLPKEPKVNDTIRMVVL